MPLDDLLILGMRAVACVLFAALLGVIAARMRQKATPRVQQSRRALLALWWAATYVSLYASAIRVWPDWFAWVNEDIEWGGLSVAAFFLLAAILNAATYLPWNRSQPS